MYDERLYLREAWEVNNREQERVSGSVLFFTDMKNEHNCRDCPLGPTPKDAEVSFAG